MIQTELIPVIHIVKNSQLYNNIDTCIECGIKKIFLINHNGNSTTESLINSAVHIKSNFGLWVGINFLNLTTEEALAIDADFDGLWCDANISSQIAIDNRKFKGTVFGCVAFKYQPQPTDLEIALNDAKLWMDVITTSGAGTGKQTPVQKVLNFKEIINEHPMAIASGVSINNISLYNDVVDYLLVASSITDRNEIIQKEKLMELVNFIKNPRP